jgi:hypothetical protein
VEGRGDCCGTSTTEKEFIDKMILLNTFAIGVMAAENANT